MLDFGQQGNNIKKLSADKNRFKELLEMNRFISLLCWFQKTHYSHRRNQCK